MKHLIVSLFLAAASLFVGIDQASAQGPSNTCPIAVANPARNGCSHPDGTSVTIDANGTLHAPTGGSGNVVGPNSSTVGNVPQYSNTSGTGIGVGLPVGATGNSTIVETGSDGKIAASLLPASGAAAGSYGSGTLIPVVTVDVTGRITNVTTTAVTGGGTPGGTTGQVQYNTGSGFGGFTVSGDGTLNTSTGAITITKLNNVSPGTAYPINTGTSGGTLGLLNANKTDSGQNTYTAKQTFSALIQGVAGTTSSAPLNIPQGSAPTSPVNGDIWTTSSSVFARINGATVDLGAVSSVFGRTGAVVAATNDYSFPQISGSPSAAQMATNLSGALDSALGNAQGDIAYRNATGWVVLTPGTSGLYLKTLGTGANPIWDAPAGAGTVTSVALSLAGMPCTVSGSPVTGSGTLTCTANTQTANTVYAGPASGSAAQPTFRALVVADLPPFSDTTKASSYSVAAGDMAKSLTLAATTGTPALTLPTASATIFAPGMTLTVNVPKITSGVNWTLTNSTGLTLRGLSSTTLLPGTQGTFVANTDAATLDFFPGCQVATATSLGCVSPDGASISIANGVISTAAPVEAAKVASFNVGSADLGYTIPASGSGVTATLTSGFPSANSAVQINNTDATNAITVTNSSGFTMKPSITSIPAGYDLNLQGDGTFIYAILLPANGSGGGGSVSVTAGTPNVVITPSPGTGTFTVGTTAPINAPADGGSHSYTALSSDANKCVELVGTFTTLVLPQATGSTFGSGYETCLITKSAITITSTTSTVSGIAGATGLKVGANSGSTLVSDGTNWQASVGVPVPASQGGTTYLADNGTYGTPGGGGGGLSCGTGFTATVGSCIWAQTASGSTSLAWTGLTGNAYTLECDTLLGGNSTQTLAIQFGEGGTPTWKTGSTAYSYQEIFAAGTSAPATATGTQAGFLGPFEPITSGTVGATYETDFTNLQSTTANKWTKFFSGEIQTSSSLQSNGYGYYSGDTAAITAIRLIDIQGTPTTFSGTCTMTARY